MAFRSLQKYFIYSFFSVKVSPLGLALIVAVSLIGMLIIITLGCIFSAWCRRSKSQFNGHDTETLFTDNYTFTDSPISDKLLF